MHQSTEFPLTFANNDIMPAFGLGTWKASGPGEVYNAVREAIRIGYRHIDCALRYENEDEVGRAIKDAIAAGEVTRKELWITTKLWNNAHHRDQVVPAIKESLNNLQLDYLDLYLIHWPVALPSDVIFPSKASEMLSLEEAPLIDTWRGMEDAVDEGLTRHIGVSNFSIKKLEALLADARIKPEMNQVESHPYLQQQPLFDYCRKNGLHFTAYSPLGSMDRPARLKKEEEPILLKNETIGEIAETHSASPAQVLIRWALQRGSAVIPKSSNPKRLQENFDTRNIILSPEDMYRIAQLDRNYRYIHGEFWTMEGSPYTQATLWDE